MGCENVSIENYFSSNRAHHAQSNKYSNKVSFNETTSCTNEETCNLFADRFMSSFVTEARSFSLDAALNNVPSDAVDVNVRDINISRDCVLKALKQVKPSYNPVPDGIPTAVLPNAAKFWPDL